MDRIVWVYVNGDIVPAEQAAVSALDHGFLYGVALFETMRAYGGRLFLWQEHVARLAAGLAALSIRLPWTEADLYQAVRRTLEANGLADAYVRLTVTAGPEGVGLVGEEYRRPSLLVFAKPVPPIEEPPALKRLRTLSLARQTPEGPYRCKSHNYLNNVLGKREAGPDPRVEGLFLTADGYVCEGVVSNVFWVKRGRLYTPSAATGLLPGIARAHVLRLAEQLGIGWEEGRYPLAELAAADEVFVTNSVQEVVPVSHIDDVALPHPYGPVTRELRRAYRQSVAMSG